eukprot:15331924-Ditylum_brightwellii.AAC.1
MEEDGTAMVSPSPMSIVPEMILELEGKTEQSLAAPSIFDKNVTVTSALIASLHNTSIWCNNQTKLSIATIQRVIQISLPAMSFTESFGKIEASTRKDNLRYGGSA